MLRSGRIITMSVWVMIVFNLLLSFAAVWSFQRMNPAIQSIYERNVVSMDAYEKMLLAMSGSRIDKDAFMQAWYIAHGNITEENEAALLDEIKLIMEQDGEFYDARRNALAERITKLNDANKTAVSNAVLSTQQLRRAGAWGIVLITLIFFTIAIFFEQRLRRSLLHPLQEIAAVMNDYAHGDRFRRCMLPGVSSEIKKLFAAINELLDR